MLITFSVENYASIGKLQEISLLTGAARGKPHHLLKAGRSKVLKFSSVYGGNASGKSNFIDAMQAGKEIISSGLTNTTNIRYNKSSPDWAEKPSTFIYKVYVNKSIYEYGLQISRQKKVEKEWLKDTVNDIYMRNFIDETYFSNIKVRNKELQSRLDLYFKDSTKENELLFLRELNHGKGDLFESDSSITYLKDLYVWLSSKIRFVYPDKKKLSDLGKYSFIKTPNNESFFSYLNDMDISISDLSIEEVLPEKLFEGIPTEIIKNILSDMHTAYKRTKKTNDATVKATLRLNDKYANIVMDDEGITKVEMVRFKHGNYGIYEFSEESDGTQRILELIEILLSPEKGVLYVVDEIDRSLHPLLTQKLIDLYLNSEEKNNQLIISTHESRLLDLKRLRKDEINFMTINKGCSYITRLDTMSERDNARTDIKIDVQYLSGRYGGVPHIIHEVE